jgi:hypothetical protein
MDANSRVMIDDVVGVNVGSSKDGGKTNGVQDD